jgi:polysaccharide export outer membrane protein
MKMIKIVQLFAFLTFAALAGCSASAPPLEGSTAMLPAPDYRLGPGDQVRVIVFGQEPLSGEFAIDGTGNVSLPLAGNVPALGATPNDLEKRIAEHLSHGYVKNARVSVQVLTFRPFYVIGEVNKPGQYPFANGMSAINAVATAGGFTYRAREDYVLITRTINGQKQERSAPVNTPILPDDVIRIPERLF